MHGTTVGKKEFGNLKFISFPLCLETHHICKISTLLWNICTLCHSRCALKEFAIHVISIILWHLAISFISSKSRPIFSENEAVGIQMNDTPHARRRYENPFLSRMLQIISW